MNDVSQRVQPARRKQSAIGRPRVLLVILAERDEYEPGAMLGVQVTHSDKSVDWAYTRLPLRNRSYSRTNSICSWYISDSKRRAGPIQPMYTATAETRVP
jgi:hypothetical protein